MMASGNFMFMRARILPLIFLLAVTPAWSRVLLRWSQPSLPAPATMGVSDLVVSWDDAALIRNARSHGYRVYAEVPASKAADIGRNLANSGVAGIVLNPVDSQPAQIEDALGQLRSAYPHLPVLAFNPRAKQPQMKGQMVIQRNGILQVTSPTAQPWVDTNLALVRLDQAFRPAQTPLYEFHWELPDPQQDENGPAPADYALAVAEAGAFHADLVLDLDSRLQDDLAHNKATAMAVLGQIKRYLAFASRAKENVGKADANVGVITDSYQKSYEPINLLARHNIPFAVLKASD